MYDRYRNGIRGHMKAVVLSLLRQYLQHEVLFNEGIIIIYWQFTLVGEETQILLLLPYYFLFCHSFLWCATLE